MKSIKCIISCCVVLVFATTAPAPAQNTSLEIRPKGKDKFLPLETRETRSGKLEFRGGYPTKETVRKIYKEIDYQRACQAYIWAIPTATMEYVNQNYLNLSGGVPGKPGAGIAGGSGDGRLSGPDAGGGPGALC